MSQLSDITDSFGWNHMIAIREICAPLFRNLGVSYFDFARIFQNNQMLLFFTDGQYVNYFLNHDEYKKAPPPIGHAGYYLWQSYINDNFLLDIKQNFQYTHGITITKKQNNYTDIFNFATPPESKQILHIYLNRMHALEMFIAHFLEKIEPLLKNIDKQDLIILTKKIDQMEPILPDNDLTKLFKTEEFYLQINGKSISISKRESQCLALLLQGKTAKEIAKILNLSHRTVETYCDKMREKTHSTTRLELLGKIENKFALKELLL